VLGRVTGGAQTLGSQTYSMGYSYDLRGMCCQKRIRPDTRLPTPLIEAGRLSGLTGTLGMARTVPTQQESSISALGGMTKEQFGTDTPVFNKLFYNVRGQLSEIRESTSYTGPGDTSWNRVQIINHYSTNWLGQCGGSESLTPMPDNNGNMKAQDVYIPNKRSGDELRYLARRFQPMTT